MLHKKSKERVASIQKILRLKMSSTTPPSFQNILLCCDFTAIKEICHNVDLTEEFNIFQDALKIKLTSLLKKLEAGRSLSQPELFSLAIACAHEGYSNLSIDQLYEELRNKFYPGSPAVLTLNGEPVPDSTEALENIKRFITTNGLPIQTNTGGPWSRTKADICEEIQQFLQTTNNNTNQLKLRAINKIRTGAFGAIYTIPLGNKTVVAKIAKNKQYLKRLECEYYGYQIVKDSAYFCKCFQFGDVPELSDKKALFLQYLKCSLGDVVDRPTEHSKVRLLVILRDVINALCDLHSNNYMHRDVKLANIMLDENNRAKMIDLEWARPCLTEEEKKKGAQLEVVSSSGLYDQASFKHKQYGTEVDIYCFGKTLHTLVKVSWLKEQVLPLDGKGTSSISAQTELLEIAQRCIDQYNPMKRPKANELLTLIDDIIIRYGCEEDQQAFISPQQIEIPQEIVDEGKLHQSLQEKGSNTSWFEEAEQHALNAFRSKYTGISETSIVLASWNVRKLGTTTPDTKVNAIAKHISDCHLIMLQELSSVKGGQNLLECVKRITCNASWRLQVSKSVNSAVSARAQAEYIGFLYRPPVMFKAIINAIDQQRQWRRVPTYVKFHVGQSRFLVCSCHLHPEEKHAANEVRKLPLLVDAFYQSNVVNPYTTFIICGDFNLPISHPNFKKVIDSMQWQHCIPASQATNSTDNTQFDNIILCTDDTTFCQSGTLDQGGSDHRLVYCLLKYVSSENVHHTIVDLQPPTI